MWQNIADALGASRYLAHSVCLTNDPSLLFLFTLADMSTAISYFTIGLILLLVARMMLRSSPDEVAAHVRAFVLDRPRLVTYLILFGLFIAACGASHATMVLTLYSGLYRLDVIVRGIMGAVSLSTAILVVSDALGLRARK
jgi:hypothetical protein